MISFDVITLFPNLFTEHLKNLPFKKAVELGLANFNLHNLRYFSSDNYKTVDDKPFGGGVGMVLKPEPIFKAVNSIKKNRNTKIVTLSPRGKKYNQKIAREYLSLGQIILICGRFCSIRRRSSCAIDNGKYSQAFTRCFRKRRSTAKRVFLKRSSRISTIHTSSGL